MNPTRLISLHRFELVEIMICGVVGGLVIIVEMFGDILSFVGLYAFILLGLCRRACTPLATSPRPARGPDTSP